MTYLAASLVFILDRVTKMVVTNSIACGESIKVLPNVFHITLVCNNGAAFSLFKGQNTILAFFLAIAIVAIVAYVTIHKNMRPVLSLALGLILGGALGNLLDRIKCGYVIDFLDFRVWPVFNAADSAITIGMSILIIILCTRHSLR